MNKNRSLWMCLLIFAVFWGGCGDEEPLVDDGPDNSGEVDTRPLAPSFALETIDGAAVSSTEYDGQVLFVSFWATWCPPCREEMPLFRELRGEYGDQGFEILAISLDGEPHDVVPGFLDELGGVNFPILLATQEVVDDYEIAGTAGIPTTYLISKNGRVAHTFIGEQPRDVFEPLLVKLLNE
ncbi:MAG: TlpA disulfide reductase family protein [Candidatus Poribacteria bacterium]|nr:TlpA disulfide reductase family protein [Candidatus Poribacteria bacterium]